MTAGLSVAVATIVTRRLAAPVESKEHAVAKVSAVFTRVFEVAKVTGSTLTWTGVIEWVTAEVKEAIPQFETVDLVSNALAYCEWWNRERDLGINATAERASYAGEFGYNRVAGWWVMGSETDMAESKFHAAKEMTTKELAAVVAANDLVLGK